MNEIYLSYVDYLKSVNFEKKLEELKQKYQNKRILLFGTGLFLDAILDNYNIKNYLNVIGISDYKYRYKTIEYKGINIYTPVATNTLGINVILNTEFNPKWKKRFSKEKEIKKEHIKINHIVQFSIKDYYLKFLNKTKSIYKYLVAGKNIFKTFYYSLLCKAEELNSRANYIKKIKKLKEDKTKKIRTVFLCENAKNTEFVSIYNKMKNDDNFKVLPIIILPENLLEKDEINTKAIEQQIEAFKIFNIEAIDGIDRDNKTLSCLHAFKPDLIFYQNPIFIKDDYSPEKVSEKALTISMPVDYAKINENTWNNDYTKKKVSNIWKMFTLEKIHKKTYAKLTGLEFKHIIESINSVYNIGELITDKIKKELNRN